MNLSKNKKSNFKKILETCYFKEILVDYQFS